MIGTQKIPMRVIITGKLWRNYEQMEFLQFLTHFSFRFFLFFFFFSKLWNENISYCKIKSFFDSRFKNCFLKTDELSLTIRSKKKKKKKFEKKEKNSILNFNNQNLVIAQLVERKTVVWLKLSLGRWFESGSRDLFFFQPFIYLFNFFFELFESLFK